ncbi:MAG: peptide/nickel transport system permease protein [Thermomicrobiales bacterium]|jgi:peptide/nickel transport system permease protein|nr:peptide/nickel transport system permease protein [Thermomicrobiales bacterium]
MSASRSVPIPASLAAQADRVGARPSWWLTLRRSNRTLLGLAVVLTVAALTILAPVIDRYDPTFGDFDNILAGPSTAHVFGTDNFGRDVFARVIYGYRVSLTVGVVSVLAAVALGLPLGLLAGYFGSLVDNLIMRPLDLLMSFPAILLAITLVAIFGAKTRVTILALALIYFPIMARVLRGAVITVRGEEYVEAARAIGAKPLRVMLRHVLPNSLGPLVVQASISMGIAILIEAALSFIGLGTQPPDPSLGGMLAEGRDFMREAPWAVTFPGLAIMLAVLGFNLLGDGLRDLIAAERG